MKKKLFSEKKAKFIYLIQYISRYFQNILSMHPNLCNEVLTKAADTKGIPHAKNKYVGN